MNRKDVTVPLNLINVFGNQKTNQLSKEERCLQEINGVLDKYGMVLQVENNVTIVRRDDE
jgi:hypothetical protein